MHHDLSIICAQCLEYFTMSADAMHQYAHLCKPSTAGNNDGDREEEDFKEDDNGNEDDEFMYNED